LDISTNQSPISIGGFVDRSEIFSIVPFMYKTSFCPVYRVSEFGVASGVFPLKTSLIELVMLHSVSDEALLLERPSIRLRAMLD
jgi:hypothetical protein